MIENSFTTVVPGDGLVHRTARAVLLLPRLTAGQLPPARALLRACATAAPDSTGRSTVLEVAGILSSGGPQFPAFGLGLDTDQGLVVLLHDEIEAEVQPAGSAPVRLSGTESLAWVERRFPGTINAFRLWVPGSPHQSYPGAGPAAAEGIPLDLSRGTLRGSGVVLTLSETSSVRAEVRVMAEREAIARPTSAHSTLPPPAHPAEQPAPPDRSHGSMLPATPQFGQPQVQPSVQPSDQPSDQLRIPASAEPQIQSPAPATSQIQSPALAESPAPAEFPGRTAAGASQVHLPIQPHLRPPAGAVRPSALNQAWAGHFPLDQCLDGTSLAAPARADLTPAEPFHAEPLRTDPLTSETLHAEPLPDGPLRTPGGGIAVPRNNVPPIEGVLCARGHFTDPQAAYCAICGISMQQVSRQITRRPRPPLGVLVLDDGTSTTVDADLIIGRDPTSHPAVPAGDAKPMFLNDEVDGVSRVHARITLVDWTVCLTDEDSANGTYLAPAPDGTPGQVVRGDVPVELASGSVIRIGRRTLTFHAYHSAGE